MKYFIFKGEEIKKGDKVKIIVRKFNEENLEYQEEVLEEFIVDEFEYYPEHNLYILNSPGSFSREELEEKVGKGELIVKVEKKNEGS